MKNHQTLVLNGFDRSGSSAICRTLSQHPEIELLFQPFNSGSIRRKMYEILTENNAEKADYTFFEKLKAGEIDETYIASHWYYKHSSTSDIQPGQLHLIKTTLNHLTTEWMQKHFPEIKLWGIWRDPMDILSSIMRNDFFGEWYLDALEQLKLVLPQRDFLTQYQAFIPQLNSESRITAFLIAVRSHYFFHYLPKENVIDYQQFVDSPNEAFSLFCQHYKLADFDFSGLGKKDLNIAGKSYQAGKKHQDVLSKEDREFAAAIFAPLQALMQLGQNDL